MINWMEWWGTSVMATSFVIGVLMIFLSRGYFMPILLGLILVSAVPLRFVQDAQRTKLDGPGTV